MIDGVDQFDAGFFGYSPRDAAGHGSPAAAVPAVRLGGARGRRLRSADVPRADRRLRRCEQRARTSQSSYANFGALKTDGDGRRDRQRAAFLTTRVSYKLDLQGPQLPRPDRVFDVARGRAPGVPGAAQRGVRHGARRRRLDQASAGDRLLLSGRGHPLARRPLPLVRCPGRGHLFGERPRHRRAEAARRCAGGRRHRYAVIRGSAINNDGARRASFTAPGVGGQSRGRSPTRWRAPRSTPTRSATSRRTAPPRRSAIRSRVQALTKAFGHVEARVLRVGSVKANIGHLDAAAGVAGLIKTVLALEHQQLPPTAHFERPNPDISSRARRSTSTGSCATGRKRRGRRGAPASARSASAGPTPTSSGRGAGRARAGSVAAVSTAHLVGGHTERARTGHLEPVAVPEQPPGRISRTPLTP